MSPLDSRTMTGKKIDTIIDGLPFDCIKTNLCEVERMPTDFSEIEDFANDWHTKYNPDRDDIIVLLGLWVKNGFDRRDYVNVIEIKHPSGVYGIENKENYIQETIEKIKMHGRVS